MAVKKLIFRHPHVFGSVDVADSSEVLVNWDALKRQEKHQESYTDTLDAVARSLPALWRAEKVQKKASKAHFDWENTQQTLEKVHEELGELEEAIAEGNLDHMMEEYGDLLFASVNTAPIHGGGPGGRAERRHREIHPALPAGGTAQSGTGTGAGRLLGGRAGGPLEGRQAHIRRHEPITP